MQIDVSILDSI